MCEGMQTVNYFFTREVLKTSGFRLHDKREVNNKYLVLGGVTNESLSVVERHIAGRRSVTLIICNDFNFSMLENSDARVSCSKIDSDCLAHDLI